MPLIEILGSETSEVAQEQASEAMTGALSATWGIDPEIITVYFVALRKGGYAHGGRVGQPVEKRRIFLKIHAYPRTRAQREAASKALTSACISTLGIEPSLVVIYFFDREPGHVAHGGKLGGG